MEDLLECGEDDGAAHVVGLDYFNRIIFGSDALFWKFILVGPVPLSFDF